MDTLITHQFRQGELVYLQHDPDQYLRQVVYIQVHLNGTILYGVACAGEITTHYEAELSHHPRPMAPDEEEEA